MEKEATLDFKLHVLRLSLRLQADLKTHGTYELLKGLLEGHAAQLQDLVVSPYCSNIDAALHNLSRESTEIRQLVDAAFAFKCRQKRRLEEDPEKKPEEPKPEEPKPVTN